MSGSRADIVSSRFSFISGGWCAAHKSAKIRTDRIVSCSSAAAATSNNVVQTQNESRISIAYEDVVGVVDFALRSDAQRAIQRRLVRLDQRRDLAQRKAKQQRTTKYDARPKMNARKRNDNKRTITLTFLIATRVRMFAWYLFAERLERRSMLRTRFEAQLDNPVV